MADETGIESGAKQENGSLYARVAEVANAAHKAGLPSTSAVAAEFSISLRTASLFMSRARKAGWQIPMSRPADTPGMRRSIEALKAWRLEFGGQKPVAEDWDKDGWRERANCKGINANLFFPERGDNHHDINAAKRVCRSCEVREQCLEYALTNYETIGIWGGMSERERRTIRRRTRYELRVIGNQIA